MENLFEGTRERFVRLQKKFSVLQQRFHQSEVLFQSHHAEDSFPDFSYLRRIPGSYGLVRDPSHLIRDFSEAARSPEIPPKQVLCVIGPLGAGKTETSERISARLNENLEPRSFSAATAEESLHMVSPHHMSGTYTPEDYVLSSAHLEKRIELLLEDEKTRALLIETPAITGYEVNGKQAGMDRGTSALVHLFGPDGRLRDSIDVWYLALIMGEGYLGGLINRLPRAHQEVRPGGSYKGTLLAEQDFAHSLLHDKDEIGALAEFLRLPTRYVEGKLPEGLLRVRRIRKEATLIRLDSALRKHLDADPHRVLICENMWK